MEVSYFRLHSWSTKHHDIILFLYGGCANVNPKHLIFKSRQSDSFYETMNTCEDGFIIDTSLQTILYFMRNRLQIVNLPTGKDNPDSSPSVLRRCFSEIIYGLPKPIRLRASKKLEFDLYNSAHANEVIKGSSLWTLLSLHLNHNPNFNFIDLCNWSEVVMGYTILCRKLSTIPYINPLLDPLADHCINIRKTSNWSSYMELTDVEMENSEAGSPTPDDQEEFFSKKN